jgi:hypothetical protein
MEMTDSAYSSSSDDDGLDLIVQAILQIQQDVSMAAHATAHANQILFDTQTGYELDFSVNVNIGKIERLNNLISGHASIFRITTGFT